MHIKEPPKTTLLYVGRYIHVQYTCRVFSEGEGEKGGTKNSPTTPTVYNLRHAINFGFNKNTFKTFFISYHNFGFKMPLCVEAENTVKYAY